MITTDSLSDLMHLAQQGDAKAYKDLLSECSDILRKFFNNKINTYVDIEDIIQEVLLNIHKARHSYRKGSPFSAWLFGIAKHKLYHYYHQHHKEIKKENAWKAIPEISESFENEKDTWPLLSVCLDQLKPLHKQIVLWKHYEALSIKEIAFKIGKSEAATKALLHRSYKTLRKQLENMLFILILISIYTETLDILG